MGYSNSSYRASEVQLTENVVNHCVPAFVNRMRDLYDCFVEVNDRWLQELWQCISRTDHMAKTGTLTAFYFWLTSEFG